MEIDKENMREVILTSPKQLKVGLELVKDVKIEGTFKNIIVCGIGGSALPVDVLNSVKKPNLPIYIHRDYDLPSEVNENSLIICISYSGNTEEGVSSLEKAISKNLKTIGIASGGKVEELCKKNNIPFVKIPSGIQPRSATGYLFSVLTNLLASCGLMENISEEILETAKKLEEINSSLEKDGQILAKKLKKKIPIIYASNNLRALSKIWKIKFNENSKIPAFHNCFPELNHNEMVGYTTKNKNFFVIILRSKDDHPRILKRMDLTASIIKKSGAKVEFVDVRDGSPSFKIFSSLLLGDWTSYYLALENKTDPTPVELVENFKKDMQK
jgi:glucose/mannose-6-phosphate isomerase